MEDRDNQDAASAALIEPGQHKRRGEQAEVEPEEPHFDSDKTLDWQEMQLTWDLKPGYLHDNKPDRYLRPEQHTLQTWLRDKHKLHVVAAPDSYGYWFIHLVRLSDSMPFEHQRQAYGSYEEALEAGLIAALQQLPDAI